MSISGCKRKWKGVRASEQVHTVCSGGGGGVGMMMAFLWRKTAYLNPPFFVLHNNLVHYLLWGVWYSVLKFKETLVESWLHLLLATIPLILF